MSTSSGLPSEEPEAVLSHIGQAVKALRFAYAMSMEQLAEKSGVSRRVISQLERGTANPSLATIDRIADALGTDFARLLLSPPDTSLVVTRSEDAKTAWRTPRGSHAALLQSTPQTPPSELWEWTLAAGDNYLAEPDPVGSYELFFVLEGTLTIAIAGEAAQTVDPGQTVRLASDREYSYRNDTTSLVRFIRVVQLAAAA